tara:strand:+ start:4698 stop:5402 length:705 start_codon:yes stop_codon:yes gene_type:complete
MENANSENLIRSQLIPVMPEAIGMFTLSNTRHEQNKESILEIIKTCPSKFRTYSKEKTEHICNNADQNIFRDFKTLSQLSDDIKKIGLSYIDSTGYICDDLIITDAWLNKANIGATLPFHNHVNSYISGTYYINFDPTIHSRISFYNDRNIAAWIDRKPNISIATNLKKNTMYNQKLLTLDIKPGQIIIWKSHIIHGYQPPNKAEGRITLSFNIMPTKVSDNSNRFSFSVLDYK